MNHRPLFTVVATVVAVGTLASCSSGTSSDDNAAAPAATSEAPITTESPTRSAAPIPAAAPTTTVAAPEATEDTEDTEDSQDSEDTEPAAGEAGVMPDVVGVDLQTAQDTIQAETDLFWSDSRDATGRGRMQIVDSNWVVVAQSPAPGTPLGSDDVPMLDVVKEGER